MNLTFSLGLSELQGVLEHGLNGSSVLAELPVLELAYVIPFELDNILGRLFQYLLRGILAVAALHCVVAAGGKWTPVGQFVYRRRLTFDRS